MDIIVGFLISMGLALFAIAGLLKFKQPKALPPPSPPQNEIQHVPEIKNDADLLNALDDLYGRAERRVRPNKPP